MMRVLVVILAVLAPVCLCRGRTITVDDDGPADFSTIQAAIDDANDGDTVEIQPGTYTGSGNRDIDFLGKAITVTGIDPADANTVAQTVIDCNSQGRGFYFHNNEDANSVLNGLTVTNATSSAIMCSSASPTVINCRLIKNFGFSAGGIYCSDSNAIIANCTFAANQASEEGGAISCDGGYPSLTGCLIVGNNSPWGGAITCRADEIIIANCRILGNGGSGVNCNMGRAHLKNCVIAGNGAQDNGVGIFCFGKREPEVTVTNCVIRNNNSPNGAQIYLATWMNMLGVYFIPELNVSFSNVQGGAEAIEYDRLVSLEKFSWGQGNIDADPCFVDPGFWDSNGTPEDANDDFWVEGQGDYHLKSQAGRWDPNEERWTIDDVTSLCIDAGRPASPIGPEPFPNGGVINMGAYGGTAKASKSHFGKPPCETIVAGDINGDCTVDFFDFGIMALHWLKGKELINSNRRVEDGIEFYLEVDKFVYHSGEDVRMLYRVINLTDEDVEFYFPQSVEWNFWIKKDGENIWAAVEGWWTIMMWLELRPGEYEEYLYVWDTEDKKGALVGPGEYDAVGGFDAGTDGYGDYDFSKVSVTIKIEP